MLKHLLVALALLWVMPAQGQDIPASPPLSAQEAGKLADKLEDDQARQELVETLRALEAVNKQTEEPEQTPGLIDALGGILGQLTAGLAALGVQLAELAGAAGDPDALKGWFDEQSSKPELRAFWLALSWKLALVLGAGLLARWLLRRILAPSRRAIETRHYPGMITRSLWLGIRTLIDMMPIVAFGVAAYGTLELASIGEADVNSAVSANVRIIAVALIQAIVVARALLAFARLVMTPLAPNLRLIPLSDEDAAYAYIWVSRFVNFSVYGFVIAETLAATGMPARAADGFAKMVGLVLAVLAVVLILQVRERMAGIIKGPQNANQAINILRSRLADVWHVLAILYVLAVFVIWALGVDGGFATIARGTIGTVGAIVVAELLVRGSHRLLQKLFSIDPDLDQRFPGLENRANRYLPIARTMSSVLIAIIAVVAICEAWGVDVLAALGTEAGAALLARIGRIGIVAVAAILVWEFASAFIARFLRAEEEEGATLVRSARTRTLLPLAQSALTIVILTVATLTILSELGLDIAPLLAGAGVIGLAIGFGAQTLVKDVITGMFILLEDAISVGDVVDVAGHSGVVEAVNIRSVRLRDLSGSVHTVPFSTIDSVKNLTKDFSYYLLDVGVAYRENTDHVITLLREIDEEMRADPEMADDILGPLEVLGLDRFDDSAVVVRARIKTNPLSQWRIGREFNRRMKFLFDKHNIEIPFPHQTIYFGVDHAGKAPPAYIAMTDQSEAQATSSPAPQAELPVRKATSASHGSADYE